MEGKIQVHAVLACAFIIKGQVFGGMKMLVCLRSDVSQPVLYFVELLRKKIFRYFQAF